MKCTDEILLKSIYDNQDDLEYVKRLIHECGYISTCGSCTNNENKQVADFIKLANYRHGESK